MSTAAFGASTWTRSSKSRSLAIIAWTQHRATLLWVAVFYVAAAIVLYLTGIGPHNTFSRYLAAGCAQPSVTSSICVAAQSALEASSSSLTVVLLALRALPLGLGMFVGAPLIARELETGSLRFTWTQGMERGFLIRGKLLLLAVVGVIGGFGIGALGSWWCAPFNGVGVESRWQAGQFEVTGLMLAGWTVLSLMIGTTVGILSRRVVTAIGVTLVATGGVVFLAYLRLHDWVLAIGDHAMRIGSTTVSALSVGPIDSFATSGRGLPAPQGSWIVSGAVVAPSGHPISQAAFAHLMFEFFHSSAGTAKGAVTGWLAGQHLAYRIAYVPAGEYWRYQLGEAAVLALLAMALGIVTTRAARRGLAWRSAGHRREPGPDHQTATN